MLWLCACVFSLNAWPPSSQKKEVFFFAVSLPQQLQCDNQQRLVEKKKKGHVSLQQHSASTQKRKHMRAKEGAKCFCTRGSAYQPVPVDKQPNHTGAWAVDHNKPRDEPLILGAANRSTPHFCGLSQYLTTRRFYLRRHPRLLPNTRCKWSMREVASCILFKAHDNPPKPSTWCLIQIHSPICKLRCL